MNSFPQRLHLLLCIVIYDGHWQETDMRARTSTCHSQPSMWMWLFGRGCGYGVCPRCIGIRPSQASWPADKSFRPRLQQCPGPVPVPQPFQFPFPFPEHNSSFNEEATQSNHPQFDGCSSPVVIGDCRKGQEGNDDAVDKVEG